ncbi:MAG: hypothetical protein ACT4PV_00940 [Planctomycetaceae bacterium]
MPTRSPLPLPLLLLVLVACESAPRKEPEPVPGESITISNDDLEPLHTFMLETRRLIVGDFVRIRLSRQYFQERMGLTRDFRYVEKKSWSEEDGSTVVSLKNIATDQATNIDPDLLPRIYFGSGLEVRAYREIRIIFVNKVTRAVPIFIDMEARAADGNARMWVGGRLEYEQARIVIRTQLTWDEKFERYRHTPGIG